MTLKLTPDQEKLIRDQLETGQFSSPEDVVSRALEVLCAQRDGVTSKVSEDERAAVQEMQDFVSRHIVRLEGMTVKQLIHEGHRF